MPHNNHCIDGVNLDLATRTREDYLQLAEGWDDPFGVPTMDEFEGFKVVRDDLIEVGSKGRFADLFIQRTKADHFCYIAPRVGYAGISLAMMCSRYGKRLTLFAPATKIPSDHQRVAMELGAEFRWVRVAAMPVLKSYVMKFAAECGATFVPLGLKDPLVTAAIVSTCERLTKIHGEPSEVWSAVSTGVLSRGLQIGWPNAKFIAVAVARNMKAGELGRAKVISYPRPFNEPAKIDQAFPCVRTYDLKAWELMWNDGSHGAWFWNVAGEIKPKTNLTVNSKREWGDKSDLNPAIEAGKLNLVLA